MSFWSNIRLSKYAREHLPEKEGEHYEQILRIFGENIRENQAPPYALDVETDHVTVLGADSEQIMVRMGKQLRGVYLALPSPTRPGKLEFLKASEIRAALGLRGSKFHVYMLKDDKGELLNNICFSSKDGYGFHIDVRRLAPYRGKDMFATVTLAE